MDFAIISFLMFILALVSMLMIPVGGLCGLLNILDYMSEVECDTKGKLVRNKKTLAKGVTLFIIMGASIYYVKHVDVMVYGTKSWGTYAVRHTDGAVTAEQEYINAPWSDEQIVFVPESMRVSARQSYRAVATEPGLRVYLSAVLKFKNKDKAVQSVDWEKPKDPMHNLETEAQNVLAKALATLDSQIFWCLDAVPYCDATNNFGDVTRAALEPFAAQHDLDIEVTFAEFFRETIY